MELVRVVASRILPMTGFRVSDCSPTRQTSEVVGVKVDRYIIPSIDIMHSWILLLLTLTIFVLHKLAEIFGTDLKLQLDNIVSNISDYDIHNTTNYLEKS